MLQEITEEMAEAAIKEFGFIPNPYWISTMATPPPWKLKALKASYVNAQCASWKKDGTKCRRGSISTSEYCLAHDSTGAYDEPK